MIEILKTINNEIIRSDMYEDGVWVNIVNPSDEELSDITTKLNVEFVFLKSALDEEERARIESIDGQTLLIVDIPIIDKGSRKEQYTTILLAIILMKHMVITVCLKDNILLNDFKNNKVKTFCTQFKTRFIFQILYKNSTVNLQYF